MLILKQNAANSVPTPPAGKGTIFLDDSDVLSVKTSDGNVENFPTVAASNSQVVFMNGTSLSGENAFTYNYNTDVLNLTGTISVGNVKTDNLLYANGAAWDLQQPGGSNTEIQFNDADSFGGSAAFTFNKTSNLVTMSGNLNAGNVSTAQVLASANVTAPQLISNVVTGTAPFVVSSTTKVTNLNADMVDGYNTSTSATANTVVVRDADGSFSANIITATLTGAATTAGTVTTAAQPNITSVGTLSSLGVSGNVTAANITANTGVFTGNGVGLTNLAGANVTGQVANALVAGTVYTAAQPNITSLGTLTGLGVNGDITAANITANTGVFTGNGSGLSAIAGANVTGTVSSATTAGTVTTAAQPNITSVGTLTSLNVSGNSDAGNFNTAGKVVASTFESNVATGTAPLVVASTTKVANLNADLLDGFSTATAATANTVVIRDADGSFSANVVTATLSGAATTAGTVTTNAQPNITSVGTLSALNVSGNITAANITANTGVFTGNGSGLSALAGANVTGQVANALVAGTVYTNAQPNITSVGTLTSVAVTGNATAGNVYANSGTIGASLLTGTLTTAAQPNITSVGTLSSLSVTGNVAAGNLTTTGVLSVTGTGVSSIAGNLDMTSNNIINLATPVNANDAATKQYVDDVAQGLHTHDSCNAATSTTLAVASGGTVTYNNGTSGVGATLTTTGSYTTIDGVTLSDGMRILVKNEANAAHNGIYDRTSSTVLTRSSDFDTPTEMAGGDFTFVTAGTLYDNTGWVMTDPVTTVGTTNVNWVQFSGAGTYTAGTGLTLTGSQFSVNASQTQVTALGTVTTGIWNNNIGSSATFAAGLSGANLASITGGNVTGQVGNALVAGTVYTAAQPNITSVGTLTSLAVTGNASAGNLNTAGVVVASTLTSNVATGTAPLTVTSTTRVANLNVATAGVSDTITVTTQSSGNAFLVLGNAVTGTIAESANAAFVANTSNGALYATTFVGAVSGDISAGTNANASNISSGTLPAARLSGTYTITVSGAATTAGTVTTAAQPNITSTGTLTSLTVSGNITAQSSVTVTNNVIHSVATGISAAGSNQGTATALTKDINVVSTVSASQGVVLPTAVAGMRIVIMNTSSTTLNVYPATGAAINAGAANAAYSLPAGGRIDFIATTTSQWYTLSATYA